MLQLALEVIAESKPSNGKAKESYDTLIRLAEGEKEVAWAENQNSIIPHLVAPYLFDNAENNISPAFLQSSGILTCHTTFDTTKLHDVINAGNNDGDSFDDENNRSNVLNSTNTMKVDANITESVNNSLVDTLSSFHGSKNVTPKWAERTPVAMVVDQERSVTTPLACTATVTKLPKSPHPRGLRAMSTLASTRVTAMPSFNITVKSPYVPSSVTKGKHCVGMTTNKHYNMAATPKHGYDASVNDHSVLTPGTKQPFAHLPPIFAPMVMKAKSDSPDEVSPDKCPTGTDYIADTSMAMGFENDFVPFNPHNKNLLPNQVEHDTTYHIDKEASVSLNRTYTQALSELEEEEGIIDGGDSKAAARKVGQEIWQRVKSVEYQPRQHDKSRPLSTVQCDGEHVKKIPGYLSMTKSAAIKRQSSTRQPPLKSNKENNPVCRKRTNTTKQSNRTVRPLVRSTSLKPRPLGFNW